MRLHAIIAYMYIPVSVSVPPALPLQCCIFQSARQYANLSRTEHASSSTLSRGVGGPPTSILLLIDGAIYGCFPPKHGAVGNPNGPTRYQHGPPRPSSLVEAMAKTCTRRQEPQSLKPPPSKNMRSNARKTGKCGKVSALVSELNGTSFVEQD